MDEVGGTLSGTPVVGTHTVELRAIDWYGNASTQSITITVVDSTPPVTPTPSVSQTPSPTPSATPGLNVYTTPGFHFLNGRHWYTSCDAYSITQRCRTEIWATQIRVIDGAYTKVNGWVFNNLTYLPSPRSVWQGNPLGYTNSWTGSNGRAWRTECDTAVSGRNGCRTYVSSTVVEERRTPNGNVTYAVVEKMVFNNIVMFS